MGRRGADGGRACAAGQARLLRQLAADRRAGRAAARPRRVFACFARMPEEQFLAWGWRVPFLLSIVLVGVGLMIRLRILETPAFEQHEERRGARSRHADHRSAPDVSEGGAAGGGRALRRKRRRSTSTACSCSSTRRSTSASIATVVLNGDHIGVGVRVHRDSAYGALSDRIGRRPVYLFGAVMTALLAYPLFWLFDTGSTALVVAGAAAGVRVLARADVCAAGARSSRSCSARAFATAARRSARSCRRPWPAASRRSSRPFCFPVRARRHRALHHLHGAHHHRRGHFGG